MASAQGGGSKPDKSPADENAIAPHGVSGPPRSSADKDRISAKVSRTFALVPSIGTRWRWYDLPYRLLRWLLGSWRRRLLPWRVRYRLNRAVNFFIAFNHYERLKIAPLDDPLDNVLVPEEEQVTQGGIWVVEFFPPSHYSQLYEALRNNGWDTASPFARNDGTNAEQVTKARRGKGFSWARIGSVANPDSGWSAFDAKRERLPDEFEYVDISAVQVGSSLTAVVAFVRLSEQGSSALNKVWKATHDPILEWQGLHRPNVEGRYFAAIRATQRERQRMHDLARSWLSDRCGGFFAGTKAGQPVVDLNLFNVYDPFGARPSREMEDALRALAMDGNHIYNYVSPNIEGVTFVPGSALRQPTERLENCWGIVGHREAVANLNDSPGYGPKPYSPGTLAAMFDNAVRSFLLYIAVWQYTRQLRETYSDARDTARRKHERFRPRSIERLSRDLLTTSLDLSAVARDASFLWESWYRRHDGITVRGVPVPDFPAPPEEFDFIQDIDKARAEAFEQLLEEDTAYRDVLSTVASLGASAQQARLGRRALLVAMASLVVALVTLLVAT